MTLAGEAASTRSLDTVAGIVSADDLAAFRAGYSSDRMLTLARQTVAGSFSAAMPAVESVHAAHFRAAGEGPRSTLDGRERERVIIALMTATPYDTLLLAVHIYWGLMEGLSPEEIAWTQLLTGAYRGIDKFTIGLGVLTATLQAMRSVMPRTDVDSVFAELTAHVAPLTRVVTRSI